jgi:hypothetical protein
MFRRTRDHLGEVLETKQSEGALKMRFSTDATVGFLFAIADGIALQVLSDAEREHAAEIEAATEAARHLLSA